MKEKISPSEWKVMEVLWNEPDIFANDIVHALSSTGWSDKTVKTLLSRLTKKGIISYTKEGKSYRYAPVIGRDACVRQESQDFIERIFHGSVKDFVTNMISDDKLSPEEIQELKDILNGRDES